MRPAAPAAQGRTPAQGFATWVTSAQGGHDRGVMAGITPAQGVTTGVTPAQGVTTGVTTGVTPAQRGQGTQLNRLFID